MPQVILGIDPGLTRCGVAVIESLPSRKLKLVSVDTLRTSPDLVLAQRIAAIADSIESVILAAKPKVIALERVFAQANVRSVMGVAQISGVVLYLAQKHRIEVQLHTPSEVKAAVTGSGRAQKAQIGSAVAKILGLDEIPKPADSADAIAIAICNAWKTSTNSGLVSPKTAAQEAWLKAERVASRKVKR